MIVYRQVQQQILSSLDAKIKSMAIFANVSQDTPEKNVRFVHSIVPVAHVVEENVWKKKRLSNVNVLRDLAANLVNKVRFCNIHDTNSQSINSLPSS